MPDQVDYMSIKSGNLYYKHKDYYKALSINARINLKSWYGNYKEMFKLAASVNVVYQNAPAILTFCGIALYDCPYGKYKIGDRLDGVTSDSIFAI
jgi:hypothetical protein